MKSSWVGSALLLICGMGFAAPPGGNAAAGHDAFIKLRCNTCHSVYGERAKAQIPLPDLSKETPETVANLIVSRTHLAPEALFDEMVMSAAAGQMTNRELTDIVTYLRKR